MRDDHDCSQTVSPDEVALQAATPLCQIDPRDALVGSVAQPVREMPVSRVSLLSADRELADAVPATDRPRAQRAMWTAAISFPAGRIDLTVTAPSPTVFALLIIQGVLTRHTQLGERGMIELMLAGDVLTPWPRSPAVPMTETHLTALDNVRLAVLDHTFIKAAAAWPGLMVTVQRRLDDQQHRLATHGAICQLPRVEQRVLAIMWLLADRMGTVTTRGTEISFALTHDALARLIGSRRPTVSLAVKRLRERGYLDRSDSGAWLLPRFAASLILDELTANLSAI